MKKILLCMKLDMFMVTKVGLLSTLYHNLQTHLNLIKDLGGNLDSICVTISSENRQDLAISLALLFPLQPL